MAAVLALYRVGQDAFNKDDLRVVETIAAPIGKAIEHAIPPKSAGIGAGAD